MFIDFLKNSITLSEEIEQALYAKIDEVSFAKNEVILKEGSLCKSLYFIEKGLTRGFLIKRGKEITNWFAPENTLATSVYSFISEKPSFENIVAVEDCNFQRIFRRDLYALYDRFPALNEMGRKLIELYYLELEERTIAFQFQSSKQRYVSFLQNEGHLLHRISLGHLASYLGMTQETLSRIRSQISNINHEDFYKHQT